jgi:hypothetical protein
VRRSRRVTEKRELIFVAALLFTGSAAAFPDGAPWEAATSAEGCNQCHFDSPVTGESRALELAGLPESIEPGTLYELTATLSAAAMGSAGFLLSAVQDGAPAGTFEARDARTSAQGAQVRSTEAGAALATSGTAAWSVAWTAPAIVDGIVSFEIWANASNHDQSPFGDATHFRVWRVPPATRAKLATGAAPASSATSPPGRFVQFLELPFQY